MFFSRKNKETQQMFYYFIMGWRDREWPLSRLSKGLFGPWAGQLPAAREVWHAAVHGVAKSWTWLSDWTELNWTNPFLCPVTAYSARSFWLGKNDSVRKQSIFFDVSERLERINISSLDPYSRGWRFYLDTFGHACFGRDWNALLVFFTNALSHTWQDCWKVS